MKFKSLRRLLQKFWLWPTADSNLTSGPPVLQIPGVLRAARTQGARWIVSQLGRSRRWCQRRPGTSGTSQEMFFFEPCGVASRETGWRAKRRLEREGERCEGLVDICGSGPRSLPVLLYWQDCSRGSRAKSRSGRSGRSRRSGRIRRWSRTTTAEAREGEHMGCHRSIFIRLVMEMDMTYMIAYDNI